MEGKVKTRQVETMDQSVVCKNRENSRKTIDKDTIFLERLARHHDELR